MDSVGAVGKATGQPAGVEADREGGVDPEDPKHLTELR
jgi:hypothetical protein